LYSQASPDFHIGHRLTSDAANRCAFHACLRSPLPKDKRGVVLISDVLRFGRLGYGDSNAVANAIGYAEHFSRSHDAVIHVYDEAGNVIETHEHKGDFKVLELS